MAARPEPFTPRVPDEAIADLRDRLARTGFPDQALKVEEPAFIPLTDDSPR